MTRRSVKIILAAAAVACVCAPTPARADIFFVPWFGSAFAKEPDHTARSSVGVSVGGLSNGQLFGFEFDFGYTPSFFGSEDDVSKNAMVTTMVDVLAGPSFETNAGKGVRPYGAFGVGLMHAKVDPNATNDFGWNAGAGAMGFLSRNIGVRFDIRYVHSVDNTSAANTVQIEPGAIHFWRTAVGLIVR